MIYLCECIFLCESNFFIYKKILFILVQFCFLQTCIIYLNVIFMMNVNWLILFLFILFAKPFSSNLYKYNCLIKYNFVINF